jgi:hypothetical protein
MPDNLTAYDLAGGMLGGSLQQFPSVPREQAIVPLDSSA